MVVSDQSSKALHGFLRKALDQRAPEWVRQRQCGGLKHRGTDMCTHMVRAYLDGPPGLPKNRGALFIDVVGAFDSVVRQLLFLDTAP